MPISLLTEANLGQVFPQDPRAIPMVEIEHKNRKQNEEAIEGLCQVAEKRIDIDKVFASREILRDLCRGSGGNIRDFIRLIRYSCRFAEETIDEEAKNQAISALSLIYDPLVQDVDLEKLARIEYERRLPSDPEYAHLPYHLLVLEYSSREEERWAAVHPSVRRLPKFKEVYERYKAKIASHP